MANKNLKLLFIDLQVLEILNRIINDIKFSRCYFTKDELHAYQYPHIEQVKTLKTSITIYSNQMIGSTLRNLLYMTI